MLFLLRYPEALPGDGGGFARMRDELLRRTFGPDWADPESALAAYQRHNDQVRAECPAGRLVEWAPVEGYVPICRALGILAPDEPFPRTNSVEEFHARSA